VKSKVDSLVGLAEKHGAAAADEFAAFVIDQIYALKQTVEQQDIDCDFELRRSYDVFLDDAEAEAVEKGFRASLEKGHKFTRDRHLLVGEMAEQVSESEDSVGFISSLTNRR